MLPSQMPGLENESQTRTRKIDRALARAGWNPGARDCIEEFLLRGPTPSVKDGESMRTQEFADYVLFDRIGRPIALVEAKRTCRSPLEGERQAAEYAAQIGRIHGTTPFIFLSNGDEHWFMETPAGPPRRISGFFSAEDLERLAFLRSSREPLTTAEVEQRIVNRAYQISAVREVSERLEKARRKFLLVMATGTGKTRTAVALVELLQRRRWVQRVLFLADRRELVKQALDAFKEFLPEMPRTRLEGGELDPAARIVAATYPGMMTLHRRLSPGAFDLIFADESHRSITTATRRSSITSTRCRSD